MAFAAQTDALSALDTGRDFNQQRIGRSIRVPQGNLFFTARCRFLQADRNLSVQIEILCRTAAGKCILKRMSAASRTRIPLASESTAFAMKHLIKEIAEHIVRVSFKVKFVIAAVVSASAERVSIRTAVRISAALLAVRAGSLVERRESELIVHFLLFRIA